MERTRSGQEKGTRRREGVAGRAPAPPATSCSEGGEGVQAKRGRTNSRERAETLSLEYDVVYVCIPRIYQLLIAYQILL